MKKPEGVRVRVALQAASHDRHDAPRGSRHKASNWAWALGATCFCFSCHSPAGSPGAPSRGQPNTSGSEVQSALMQAPRRSPLSESESRLPHEEPAPSPRGGSRDPSSRAAVLPAELPLGVPLEVVMAGDRSLRVAHAAAPEARAIVYLHGMCGNPRGADGWLDLATQRGTFIVVRGDVKCPERPGYKWPQNVESIHARILEALKVVRSQRGGLLDIDAVTLIGYSQGAHRAERLAEAHPDFYPRLILGGPPTSPEPQRLGLTRRVAVLGGELEESDHMQSGALALQEAGIAARFFLLPSAHHGSYGPLGHDVMRQVLDWLY